MMFSIFIFRLNKFLISEPLSAEVLHSISSSLNSTLVVNRSEGLNIDLLIEEVLVVLQWVVLLGEVVVWWTVSLLEGTVFLTLLERGLHL